MEYTAPLPPTRPRAAPLYRPRTCLLGGVCSGLAAHLGWSVTTVRWIMAGLSLVSGAGILLYLWLWAMTPLEHAEGPGGDQPVRRFVPVAWLLFAIAVVVAAVAFVIGGVSYGSSTRVPLALIWLSLVAVVCAVASVAWEQFIDVRASESPKGSAPSAVRIASGVFLIVTAFLEASLWSGVDALLTWPVFVLTFLAGLAVLFGPWALKLWRELITERTARVREEQRAEIAAHLHDSVLQTLALIQNRAGASSEVARIARAQERELRDWLYAGSSSGGGDLATDLRDVAAALELDYPVRIEVVAIGEPVEPASGEVAAAAREATLNAARHAGGEVSVYLESSVTAVDVFVRDRGPGFDLADVPDDRLGVRESIIGRMKRVGGTASVGSGTGGVGTEVHLHLDREAGDGQ